MNKPIIYIVTSTINEEDYVENNDVFNDYLYDMSSPKSVLKKVGDDLELADIKITPIINDEGKRCLTFMFLYSKIENYEN
jgi:hypothetical protein